MQLRLILFLAFFPGCFSLSVGADTAAKASASAGAAASSGGGAVEVEVDPKTGKMRITAGGGGSQQNVAAEAAAKATAAAEASGKKLDQMIWIVLGIAGITALLGLWQIIKPILRARGLPV